MSANDEGVVVRIGDRACELSRADAAALQDAIGAALTEKREFLRTAGEYRPDGRYVVSRRGADSSGNAKVFDSFDATRRLFDRLPAEFTDDDVDRTGITGSRRHMVVRHFGEHPAFDCDIVRRNPLTVAKTDSAESDADAGSGADGAAEAGESPESVDATDAADATAD